jgi:hypothetical protein
MFASWCRSRGAGLPAAFYGASSRFFFFFVLLPPLLLLPSPPLFLRFVCFLLPLSMPFVSRLFSRFPVLHPPSPPRLPACLFCFGLLCLSSCSYTPNRPGYPPRSSAWDQIAATLYTHRGFLPHEMVYKCCGRSYITQEVETPRLHGCATPSWRPGSRISIFLGFFACPSGHDVWAPP